MEIKTVASWVVTIVAGRSTFGCHDSPEEVQTFVNMYVSLRKKSCGCQLITISPAIQIF